MNRLIRLLAAVAVCAPLLVYAQNLVFNDSFTGDSISPATYPTVTSTSTGWQVLSSKSPTAPSKSSSSITVNMVSTSSGFIEAEALFAPSTVKLLPGTYVELQLTFVPTAILIVGADTLNVGMFNSGGVAPVAGLTASGLSSSQTTFATGGAKGWQGFNTYFTQSGTPVMKTRAAQTGTNNTVQDTLFDGQSSSVGYTSPASVSATGISAGAAALTNGNTYTLAYRLTLSADGATITATNSLYNGTGTTNAGANTRIITYSGTFSGASLPTNAFDAFAIGWRANSSTAGGMVITGASVRTTGGTPWFTTLPPANMVVTIGDSLNLNAVAAGTGISGYQWQFSSDGGSTYAPVDATANPSAATASLTLTNVQSSAAGKYRLVVTNAAGSSTSAATTVTTSLTPVAPTISIDPTGNTVLAGASQTFSVVANGSSPLTYQWQKSSDNMSFAPIAGATNSSYAIPSTSLADEGYYNVVVTNSVSSATSASAQLVVDQPLTITTQPAGAALNVGDNYTLTVVAAGKPAPSAYQWSRNGVAIGGATNQSYAITSATAASAGVYTVTVTSSSDTTTSTAAPIVVLSSSFTASSAIPSSGSTGVNVDTPIKVTFSGPVSVGTSGTIKIFDVASPTLPVDTIDVMAGAATMATLRGGSTLSTQALPVLSKTIGGATNFNYYPITVSGSTATIYPRNGVLRYGHSYYVTVDPGVFLDSTGLSWSGVSGNTGYTFSVKTAGPLSNATRVVVAADGSGDFSTVQGAIDWVPVPNTTLRTIFVKRGTYFEQVYFTGKTQVAFVGEDRTQTIITYPNNNNFNSGGTTRRMVFCGDKNSFISILNLTIANSTPKGGSQAEALVLNGNAGSNPAIVANVDLTSYQDTLLAQGQVYVTNCHISGDVDFMWGSGSAYFDHCQLTQLTTGGYFTQIRNGTSTHGFVYVNCQFNAPAGVTSSYFGRIDPSLAQFPYSEVVLLDSTVGDSTNNAFLNTTTGVSGSNYQAAWWLLNNASSASAAPNVHNWYNTLVGGTGAALTSPNTDAFTVMPTDATTQANYRNVTWVLNTTLAGGPIGSSSWTPQLAPIFAAMPAGQSLNSGTGFTLTAQGVGVPTVAYQWYQNGVAIAGATNAAYSVTSAAASDAGAYTVALSNAGGTVTSPVTSVVVNGAAPVIMVQPVATSALPGTTATFGVYAVGDTPITYQWSKDGAPIAGATNASLRVAGVGTANLGNYSVAVTNGGGTTQSSVAALTLATPATTMPVLPVIPANRFDVTAVPYGAVGDGQTDNTAAIQAAINAAIAAGGGTVEIPGAASAYLSGPLTLGSNIDLQVDAGATLQALPYGTYPNSFGSPSHFITIPSGASNVELSGNGTIDGNGNAWWTAFNANSNQGRPRLVQITKASNVLITGLTFRNSPMFHLTFSGANTNVTIFGITITAPGDSPNTDGMDLAGSNFLVQGCSVADGDDNIVAKPGSVFCQNLYISNCTIGTGHGVSVGGQTNVGMNGMTVTNCTFNGTDTGLRLKADATQGGPVQNLTFSNLTMTNVTYPVVFYSYYNQIGSPGAVSGSSQTTTSKVNAFNSAPPNSLASTTIPTWQNITLSNITATGSTGYSIIWGLPLANALISNVTFNNVTLSGAGLELYDANGIQFTGTNSVGTIVIDNALAMTSQPQAQTVNVGDSVTFTASAIGAMGATATTPSYRWALNGTPLNDGVQSDGSTISGAATPTLTITNARVTRAGNYTVAASLNLDGYNVSSNAFAAGSLPTTTTSSAAALTVNAVPATVSLSGLNTSYTGSAQTPVVTTTPGGIAVAVTYNGKTAAPVDAGTYNVVATITDPNYVGSTSGVFTISPSQSATIRIQGLSAVYDGKPHPVTVTTSPAGLPVFVEYNGDSAVPVNAGSYTVSVSLSDSNYSSGAIDRLVIAKADQTISFATPTSVDPGTPSTLAATATSGLPVMYTVVAGAATLDGSALTATGTAKITVRATQAGDSNHNAASADLTMTVTTRQPQSITFAAIPSHMSNDPGFTLSASASSGLPVSFAVVSGPAIVSGSTLTLTGAPGTVTVRATQPGDSTFAPASADRSFNVADATTDTFFGDLVPATSAEAAMANHHIEAASKSGDVAAAIVEGTKQGNLIIVAPSVGLNVALPISINADGTYSVDFKNGTQLLTLAGALANGVLTGEIAALNLTFSTNVQSRTGSTSAIAGYYSATALNTAQGSTYSIVGPDGQALVLTVTPIVTTGGLAQITSTGAFTLTPSSGVTISGDIDAGGSSVSTTLVASGQTITFSGAKNQTLRTDRLVNLSARTRVSGGDRVAISGFVIGGSDSKQVLVRAIGPGLTTFGVSGVLPSPHLQLYRNGQVIAENVGWSTAANASDISAAMTRIGAFALSTGSNDSAILMTLAPGTYSAIVSDGTSTGVALVEIYDASANPQGEYQRLANISARGDVGTGEDVLIGGFVVTGNAPKKLLIRGVGPGLSSFGVSGALVDPKLRVYQGTNLIAENDNWGAGDGSASADVSNAVAQTGAFPLSADSKDAALVLTLAPGSYTAQVWGVNGATGIALVEVYEVP